jgi:serine/threonine protein phosphatase PrpC
MSNNIFGLTDRGMVRENNEDAFLSEQLDNGLFLACVIDGVGGYEGGEVAAAIAKDCICKKLSGLKGNEALIPKMLETLLEANEEIYFRKKENPVLEKMACVLTVVLADIQQNQLYYAHVGDTRLYLFRDEVLVKITQDQSFVGFLEDSGRLTEAEAMKHPKRNEINQALGLDSSQLWPADFVETGQSPFLPGDLLLLCSDGLTDRIDAAHINRILLAPTSLDDKAAALVHAANQAGGQDNITVVLVRNDKAISNHVVTKPAARPVASSIPEAVKDSLNIKEPAQKKNRGLVFFLLILVVLLLGTCAWMYQQIQMLKEKRSIAAPVYENPWVPMTPGLKDTLKKPLRDTIYYRDSIPGKMKKHEKRPVK